MRGDVRAGATEAMVEAGAHAATDVTGFGVLGHVCGMADGAGVTMRVRAASLPRIEGLDGRLMRTFVCGGLKRNLRYGELHGVRFGPGTTEEDRLLVGDPQTSGGMLVAVAADRLDRLLEGLARRGVATRAVVGEVVPRGAGPLEVL